MTPTAGVVSLHRLSRQFGDVTAVQGLEFQVHPGELFGVVGPDGAGKTTLMRMLAGVLTPTEGDALIHGMSVARDPERVKPMIAYMAQRFGMYADLTVRENIEFYADLYRVPRRDRPRRVERLYAFSNLGPFEGRLAGQLSGGMKQKLSLCCALIHEPQVLLLDEPTFGVDPISRRDLWLIVHEMVARGTTAIVSTSYLDEAERCDRVAMLHEGRLIGLDTPLRLQQTLQGRVVALSGDRPRHVVTIGRDMDAFRTVTLFGASVHAILREGFSTDGLDRALAEVGLDRCIWKTVAPTLEDVFIDRMRVRADPHG